MYPFKQNSKHFNNIDCLRVFQAGRLGNNLINIGHAMNLAQILNINKIYVPKKYWFINESIKILFDISKYRNENINCYNHHFSYHIKELPFYENKFDHILNCHLKSILKYKNFSNQELFIHLRSGDIFDTNIHKDYSQPPLCFYRESLKKEKYNYCQIISENLNNPILLELTNECRYKKEDFLDEVSTIFYSKKIIISYGSFCMMLIRLSYIPKIVYAFETMKRGNFGNISSNKLVLNFNLMTKTYYENMITWKNSEIQRYLLINMPCNTKWSNDYFLVEKNYYFSKYHWKNWKRKNFF